MLSWTLVFLLLALIAGALAFTSLVGAAALIAQVLCGIFLVLLVVAGLGASLKRKNP